MQCRWWNGTGILSSGISRVKRRIAAWRPLRVRKCAPPNASVIFLSVRTAETAIYLEINTSVFTIDDASARTRNLFIVALLQRKRTTSCRLDMPEQNRL